MITGLSLGFVPLMKTVIPNAVGSAGSAITTFMESSSDPFARKLFEMGEKAEEAKPSFDGLTRSLNSLSMEIGMGVNPQITAYDGYVGEGVVETDKFKEAAKDATKETAAWWQKLSDLNERFAAMGTDLNPQASRDAGAAIVTNLVGGMQDEHHLFEEEGLSIGQTLSGAIGAYWKTQEAQEVLATGADTWLESGSFRTSLEEMGQQAGAIIGFEMAGPIGAVLGQKLGETVVDGIAALTMEGNPDFIQDASHAIAAALLDDETAPNQRKRNAGQILSGGGGGGSSSLTKAEEAYISSLIAGGMSTKDAVNKFMKEKKAGKTFGGDGTPAGQPAGKVVAAKGHQAALDYLGPNLMPGGRVSIAKLRQLGRTNVALAVTDLNAFGGASQLPGLTKSAVIGVAGGGKMIPQTLMGNLQLTAAHGMDRVIRRPTNLLVGEAGPERVQVTPTDAGRGGRGNKQVFLNIHLNMLDVRGMPEFIRGKLGPMLTEYLREESERGVDILYNRGVIPEVAA